MFNNGEQQIHIPATLRMSEENPDAKIHKVIPIENENDLGRLFYITIRVQ